MEQFLTSILTNYLTILTLIVLFFLGLFLFNWLREPRRLINGVLFQIFFVFFTIWLAALVLSSKNNQLITILGWAFLFMVAGIVILLSLSWLFLLWNSFIVWKRESHSLANSLTFLLGIALLFLSIFSLFNWNNIFPKWVIVLFSFSPIASLYLELTLWNFLINLTFYQFIPKRKDQDYLIVLGAGLLDGDRVSPLLQNRITAAVNFNNKQLTKNHSPVTYIMSGGQGPDEKIPEAIAMKNTAIAMGIDPAQILVEDRSRNTLQNMEFSKYILTENYGSQNFKSMFVTNNFHTFRAGLLAKEAGLDANGIGAKTKFYFLPNAILREFAAVFMMHKVRHFTILGIIVGSSVVSAIFELLSK